MSNFFYPRCSRPLSSPVQTITPSFIPLFQLAIKILTIPRRRAGVPRVPPEPELHTNGELLMSGRWEQLWNSSAELSPRLCLLSSWQEWQKSPQKSDLCTSPQSLWLCQGWKWLCLDGICSLQICWLFFSLVMFWLYRTGVFCIWICGEVHHSLISLSSLWKTHHPSLKNTQRTVLRLENRLQQREFL